MEASLSSAFRLSKAVGNVPFQQAVRESSGFLVVPFDTAEELDKEVMAILSGSLSKFLKTLTHTKSRLQGKRPLSSL